MMIWTKNNWVARVTVPDLKDYIGRHCKITDDNHKERVVECQELQGSLKYPTKIQINCNEESFLISMLDFFAQMNGERVSKEEIEAFDATMFEVRANPGWKPFGGKQLWKPR